LFISSVDFSHHVDEPFAYLHDIKSRQTLVHGGTSDDYSQLEVDCPSCLHLTNELASSYNQKPNLFHRDSSQNLYGNDDNTSRLFVYYDEIGGKTIS
jgi:hypothetical protein